MVEQVNVCLFDQNLIIVQFMDCLNEVIEEFGGVYWIIDWFCVEGMQVFVECDQVCCDWDLIDQLIVYEGYEMCDVEFEVQMCVMWNVCVGEVVVVVVVVVFVVVVIVQVFNQFYWVWLEFGWVLIF